MLCYYCLSVNATIISSFLILYLKYKNSAVIELKKQATFKRILTCLIFVYRTVLYPFHLTITISGLVNMDNYSKISEQMIYVIINLVNIVLILGILLYSSKIFKFSIPNKNVFWSSPNHK